MKRALAILAVSLSPLLACQGCSAAQQQAAVPAIAAVVECVYEHVDACIVAKTPWIACTEQTAIACGVDVPGVVSIWASKQASEARERGDGGVNPASYP